MGRKLLNSNQPAGLFTRWTCKRYAVFCSLGSVVNIGHLSVQTVQWIGEIIQSIETELTYTLKIVEEDSEIEEENAKLLVLASDFEDCAGQTECVIFNINNRQ